MNTVKIADLKNNLSRHLARVRKGSEVTVLDRDTPVARLVPFTPTQKAGAGNDGAGAAGRVAELVRQGIVSPGSPRAVAKWVDGRRLIRRPAGSPSAVDVLLEMRRESTR